MSGTSTFELLLRLILSLGVVIGLMASIAWVLRRTGAGGFAPSGKRRNVPVEVLARQTLGRRSSIAIVRAGGRGLVLGITDTNVTLLVETDPDELFIEAPGTAPSSVVAESGDTDATPWKALLEGMREKTLRR